MNRFRGATGAVEFDSIVFDLFHTLVDPQEHAPAGFRRLDVVAGILGLPLDEIELWWQQNVAEFVSTPVSPIAEFVSTPVSPIEAIIELARSRRIVLSPTAVAEIDRAMGAAQDAAIRTPVRGVLETLQALAGSGVTLAILSNAHVRDVRTFGDSPLAEVVADACVSCFTGLVKPDRIAYDHSLERIGTVAERSLYVGDGGGNELVGARDAGFVAVVAITGPVQRGGWRSRDEQTVIEEGADFVTEDVVDLSARIDF
jgi:putative hydrolase of the HAD superfamily